MTTARTPLVLLVDDYVDALDLYTPHLAQNGVRVVTAASGQDALRVARRERPDLILMDLVMAEMTGTAVMRTLRTEPGFTEVPIIAFTADVLSGSAAIIEGFDGVITKPCWPDDLVKRIQPYLVCRQ